MPRARDDWRDASRGGPNLESGPGPNPDLGLGARVAQQSRGRLLDTLHGVSREEFEASEPELVVLVTGVDETFAQTLHARSSYQAGEVAFGARFRDMFLPGEDGRPTIDAGRLHDVEALEPGA